MRKLPLSAASAVVLILAACGKQAIQLTLPVPPGNYRSETATTQRAHLPLNEENRAFLKRYIEYGGVRDRIKPGKPAVFIVTDQSPYGRLLKLLSDPAAKLTADDLVARPTFREWFHGPVIRTVLDARDEEYLDPGPPDLRPLAVSDGHLFWIFYPDNQGMLTGLMVVNNPQPAQKRGKY